jgi:hypothetical protein
MLLEKTTHHSRSISLTKEEFEVLQANQYTHLDVYGPKGKLVQQLVLTSGILARLIAKARLVPTQHKDEDGETRPPNKQVWYWVVNLP